MATTVNNASLTVTVEEFIVLNGKQYGGKNKVSIPDINEIDTRIVSIPSGSESGLMSFVSGSQPLNSGTYRNSDVKYIRITNLDNTNYCAVRVLNTGGDTFEIQLDAGKSFMMGNTVLNTPSSEDYVYPEDYVLFGYVDQLNAPTIDAQEIRVEANTADVDLEYLIALT
jgi:hypothetical protein